MSDKWLDELERISRQKQEEREREESEGKTARERVQHIIAQWNDPIKSLLEHIGEATWADRGLAWRIRDPEAMWADGGPGWMFLDTEAIIVWSVESDSHIRDGFDVKLVVDVNAGHLPREFLVVCHKKTLRTELSLEALKATLLEAYKVGPRVWGALATGE